MKSYDENWKVLWPLYAITYIGINGFMEQTSSIWLFSHRTQQKQAKMLVSAFLLFWTSVRPRWGKLLFEMYTQKTMSSNLRQPKHTPYVFKKRYYSYKRLVVHFSRVRIVVSARMRCGVFMPKMRPNDRGFESPETSRDLNNMCNRVERNRNMQKSKRAVVLINADTH
jgi:hypothetical protein